MVLVSCSERSRLLSSEMLGAIGAWQSFSSVLFENKPPEVPLAAETILCSSMGFLFQKVYWRLTG